MNKAYINLAAIALLSVAIRANAVEIVSVEAEGNRIEGESVAVSAAIKWTRQSKSIIVPHIKVVQRVTATISPAPVREPAVPNTMDLTFDSTTGRYHGRFDGLPFNNYILRIRALRTETRVARPGVTTSSDANTTRTFSVGAPAGCFNFPASQELSGWSVPGIFSGDGLTNIADEPPTLVWAGAAGFLNQSTADGGLALQVRSNMFPPPATFAGNAWRIDLVSANLSKRPGWPNISGISFRMAHNLGTISVQPLLFIRKADGQTTFLRQQLSDQSPVFLPAPSAYSAFVARIAPPLGATVLGVHLRVFGANPVIAPNESFIFLDGVCPQQ